MDVLTGLNVPVKRVTRSGKYLTKEKGGKYIYASTVDPHLGPRESVERYPGFKYKFECPDCEGCPDFTLHCIQP